ncbi:MAG: Bifunctional hemolysin/adenylate cyclase precursor, partial [Planctomycetota bacterium]
EGNGGTDYLEWNDGSQRSGNDILRGGEGDDYLAGDSNSEQFYGGNGNDMVYASGVTQVTLSDLDYTSSGVTSAGHGVERWELYGTNSDDSIDASAWTGNGLRIYGYGGNDVLKGGAGNDDLRGDDGNDDITGGGGQDYLNGQSGNDTIRVPNSSFSQVIGEAGLDRFIVNSAGVAVNLVANSTSYMQGIEEIDLTGMGNNSLILNQSRVLTLSDSTDTLIVMGNPGDSLTNDAGWTTTGTETINGALYKVQTNGAATLKVQQATDVRIEREIQQFNYAFDNANSDGFSGTFALAGVQNYQGLGNTGNTFNASFLKSSNSATLTLNNLPDHDAIELDFLLAIIDSWDGGTSDYFNILIDGTTVFRESFSVFDSANQSYSPPPGGRVSFGSNLGFSSWVDAAYDMSNETRLQRIPHSGSSLTIAWQANGPGWEAGDNESWAIDNLKVTLWGSQFAVPDNLAAGEYIGNLTTTDIDPTNSFTYALTSGSGDTDNAYFSIVGNELRTALPLIPSKSSYSIRMRATDNAGIPFDKVLLVQVIPSNQSPSDIALSNLSIAENADPNSLIGSFSTTDPNEGDTFTYSLVSGTGDSDNAAFTIDGTSLRAVNSFDFETKSSYSIRVRSTDQGDLWTEKVFTISVTNVNESPTDIALSSTSIAENNLANAAVGSLSTTDVDASNSFTYSLVPGAGDSDNGAFSIDGSTLRANSSFDFESKPSYSVRIRSTDQGGLFFEKDFTINVTDLDENRYFDGLAAADSFIASYTGDGIQAAWTLTRNGVALFNGSIPNGGALVINALAGADTLQVNGRAVDDLLTFDANRITVNNAPVLFSNTEIVKLLAGLGNDQMIFVTPAASGVSLFYDGGTGTDRVETLTGSNIWNVTGAGIGNVNSKLTFLAAETLVGGSGDDQFILANAGKVTGQILGGTGNDTLNLAAKTTAHTINLQSNTATSTGGIGSIESFIGGNTATVTDVLIGPNVATSWSIDGINAGSVSNATLGSVAFSGFESLTGGTAADSFVITNAGNITKTLTGGTAIGIIDTLDLSAKTAALDFRLDATASSVPNSVGSYVGFETITGNSVAGSKVTRVNNTTTAWAVDTLGQIVVNSVTYRNVPGIAGGIGADTLTGPALTGTDVSTWTLDSAGGGTLAIPGISIAFSGMNNLTGGTGADAFEVLPAGSLSGAINGGTGTGINSLSYAQWTSNVSVNLAVTTVANATAIAGLTSNIQMVTGGAGNDTLQGQAAKSTVLVGLAGNDTLIGGSQRDLLFGGLGVDNISGVGGDDLIVSGTTSYDTNRTALLGIVAEWISTRTFAVRTANIWGNGSGTRNNGIYFLNSDPSDAITDTVFADADLDSLMGGLNQDWFFSSASESLDFVGTGATPDRRNG